MGSLSNLYISQSYQSLIHLATNNTASATLIDLQDGLGNSIGVSVNTGGDLSLSGSFTASLQQGYVWVGNSNNKTSLVATSSFGGGGTINTGSLVTTASFNQYTSSTNNRLNNLESTSASVNISISNLNSTTASQGISISNLNQFTASQNTKNTTLENVTASLQQFTASNGNTSLNTYTQSNDQKWTNIGNQSGSWITESETGSFARYDVSNPWSANQTFTNISAVSASFQYVQTTYETASVIYSSGSNQFGDELTDIQTLSGSVKVQGSLTVNGINVLTSSIPLDSLNSFTASQNQKNTTLENVTASLQQFTSSINLYTASTNNRLNNLESTSASVNISISNLNQYTQSNDAKWNTLGALTGSLSSSVNQLNIYTASNDAKWNALQITTASFSASVASISALTGSYATTGSNVFTGIQTFRDAALNATSLVSTSGSLMLVARSFTSASAHLTASAGTFVNLIFKDNNNTPDTIISGSNNIFVNALAPTAGFKRYVGGSGNIYTGTAWSQISSSMAYTVAMNRNIGNSSFTMRGPVSSSTWTLNDNLVPGTVNIGPSAVIHAQSLVSGLTMSTNLILGTLAIAANQGSNFNSAPTISGNNIGGTLQLFMSSSVINASNNIVNDSGTVITNQYYSSSIGLGNISVLRNNFSGQVQTLIVSGALGAGAGATVPSFTDNAMFGGANTIFTNVSAAPVTGGFALHSAVRNLIAGNQLIITGSSSQNLNDTYGSAYVGRWNANDGIRNTTNNTIFVVGTGKNNTDRKTGFLIDSGSNTFVEGTLNVSGSTSISGSTSMTGSLTLFSSSAAPNDLIMYGHKMFNVGAFQDTTTQSGSANTAYAFKFNTTDISQGVAISGSTGLKVTNAGTYNVQWSGQAVNGAGGEDVSIWLRKNGVNINGTAGVVTIASNTKLLPAWNWVLDLVANDTIEIMWGSTGGNSTWSYIPAATIYPAAASIIATVTQVR